MSLLDKDDFLAQLIPNVTREVEGDCTICYEPVTSATETACQHIFCLECLTTWLQSSATCPHCRHGLYQPEEEDEEEDAEDQDEDEESEDQSDEETDEDRTARMDLWNAFRPIILGHENIDFRDCDSDYNFHGTLDSYLPEAMQEWLDLIEPGGEYTFRNQHIDMEYVENKIFDVLQEIVLWLKEDTQDGRSSLEEVCREDWKLGCVSVHDSLFRHKGSVMKADAFRVLIVGEWEERQRRADRVAPEYAARVFEDRVPGPRQSFQEQFDYLLDIVLDYSKDGYRPGVTWPDNAAPLKAVHIDMYELFDGIKEFEAFERDGNFDLNSNMNQRAAIPDDDESLGFWDWTTRLSAALLRIKPDPPSDATEEAIARDDWCAKPWAIVNEIVENVCMILHSRNRLRGEELKVSDLIDAL